MRKYVKFKKPPMLLGFMVVHGHYRFERDCQLITNILYSY